MNVRIAGRLLKSADAFLMQIILLPANAVKARTLTGYYLSFTQNRQEGLLPFQPDIAVVEDAAAVPVVHVIIKTISTIRRTV